MSINVEKFRESLFRNLKDVFFNEHCTELKKACFDGVKSKNHFTELNNVLLIDIYYVHVDEEGDVAFFKSVPDKQYFEMVSYTDHDGYNNLTAYQMHVAVKLAEYLEVK